MNHRQQEVLRLLLQARQPVPAARLAAAMEISERSIRSYIHEIDPEGTFIQSTSRGFVLAGRGKARALLQEGAFMPESHEERAFWIIRRVLLDGEEPELLDVCDLLAVSASTLRQDLVKMNRAHQADGLRFGLRKGCITCTGDEESVRKVISRLLRQQAPGEYIHLDFLRTVFAARIVDRTAAVWTRLLEQWQTDANELRFVNLVSHTVLIVCRRQKDQSAWPQTEKGRQLAGLLQKEFGISLSVSDARDLDEMALQATGCQQVSPEIHAWCESVTQYLEDRYFVKISRSSFLPLFEAHAQQLLYRMKSHAQIPNPMTPNIRAASPLIFEMAVEAAVSFSETFGCTLDENETAFFALHIGTQLAWQQEQPKILAVCPAWHGLKQQFLDRLQAQFGHQALIEEHTPQDVPETGLIVSAMELPGRHALVVSPFLNPQDLDRIARALHPAAGNSLIQGLLSLTAPDLFSTGNVQNAATLIEQMAERLVDHGYAKEDLACLVLEREQFASTAYGGFAIPHPQKPAALVSAAAVHIDPAGMDWNGQRVYAVFLLCPRADDTRLFHTVYEPLIRLLQDESCLRSLTRCSDYRQFCAWVCSLEPL